MIDEGEIGAKISTRRYGRDPVGIGDCESSRVTHGDRGLCTVTQSAFVVPEAREGVRVGYIIPLAVRNKQMRSRVEIRYLLTMVANALIIRAQRHT